MREKRGAEREEEEGKGWRGEGEQKGRSREGGEKWFITHFIWSKEKVNFPQLHVHRQATDKERAHLQWSMNSPTL